MDVTWATCNCAVNRESEVVEKGGWELKIGGTSKKVLLHLSVGSHVLSQKVTLLLSYSLDEWLAFSIMIFRRMFM